MTAILRAEGGPVSTHITLWGPCLNLSPPSHRRWPLVVSPDAISSLSSRSGARPGKSNRAMLVRSSESWVAILSTGSEGAEGRLMAGFN